jgi:uncharacterized SAM-binding protein YcdF (DUF218 family)
MIYLHKILPLIFSPLFLVIFIMCTAIALRSKKISFLGILFLVVSSLPVISKNLLYYLEKDYPKKEISEVKNADAIVVLSGMIKIVNNNKKFFYEFNGSVDRILAGIDLIKKDKAPYLILTRGKVPWTKGKPEGEYLYDFALKLGVDKDKILLTEKIYNTDDEAKSIKKLFNDKNLEVILVTSSFHMVRAKKIFEATAIKVEPFPVDFRSSTNKLTYMDIIPSASALNDTSNFVREMIGRIYYNLIY